MVWNELHDRERESHWQYRSECVSSSQDLVREQVETDQGPVFRVLALDGAPLDEAQREREDARLNEYLHDPARIAHILHAHEEDEARLAAVMQMLPDAFLFDYDGPATADVARIAFRPNPAFVPSGYEARIVHALAGTITVNLRLRRMIEMRGTLLSRVDFGYGFLGHVEKGGTFTIHRRQVNAEHWKTDLVDVHVQGKVLLLKTVSKDQREARSDFRPVAVSTTLAEARDMLNQAAGESVQARLVPAAAEPK
ncbi:MAG TPA: hypothetical protein VMD92_12050 [Acidobacteriaceae bacterium]|nr:hypothetical protein [Acidobacteriaceae bacterium]